MLVLLPFFSREVSGSPAKHTMQLQDVNSTPGYGVLARRLLLPGVMPRDRLVGTV